jgi:hypothetical protein
MRDLLLGWLEDNMGTDNRAKMKHEITIGAGMASTRQVDAAPPTVYPDRNAGFRPRLPEVADVAKVDRQILRGWLRNYLNYLWSTSVSFTGLNMTELVLRMAWWEGNGALGSNHQGYQERVHRFTQITVQHSASS